MSGYSFADQWPGRSVTHARREMLLNNKTRRARCECFRIATQERRRARFRNRRRDFRLRRLAPAHIPNREHVTFAIRHRDDAVWRDFYRASDRLINHPLNIGGGELRVS